MKWLAKINIVEAALVGLFLTIIPACYVMVEVSDSNIDINEVFIFYMFWCMMAAPAILLMFLCYLARGGRI